MSKPVKPTLQDLLNLRRYDPARTPAPEQVILKIGSKKVGSLQNLVTLSGKQKNGKTRYLAATIAAGITKETLFDIELKLPANRPGIALFDTEQGDYDFYRQIAQVKHFTKLTRLPETFEAFNTREDNPLTILKMIDHYCAATPTCSAVFVDGILDLILDFNNVSDSKRLTNYFKKITKQYNILLIGVIHRGKGNDTTIGNIGAMADRLAQSVLKVEKDKDHGTFTLSADFLRSDEDFTPIHIWNNGREWQQVPGISEPAAAPVKPIRPQPADMDYQEHFENIQNIFNGGEVLSYEGLIQLIKEVYGTGRNWAVDCIKHLRSENLIFRISDGYTNIKQAKIKFK